MCHVEITPITRSPALFSVTIYSSCQRATLISRQLRLCQRLNRFASTLLPMPGPLQYVNSAPTTPARLFPPSTAFASHEYHASALPFLCPLPSASICGSYEPQYATTMSPSNENGAYEGERREAREPGRIARGVCTQGGLGRTNFT